MDFIDDVWNDEKVRTIAVGAPIRRYDHNYTIEYVAAALQRHAEQWVYRGDPNEPGFRRHASNTHVYHIPSSANVSFARDEGAFSKGGPCERCYHFAVRYIFEWKDAAGAERAELLRPDGATTKQWLEAIFGENLAHVWAEPAAGLSFFDDVLRWIGNVRLNSHAMQWHFYLFTNEAWEPVRELPETAAKDLRAQGFVPASELVFRGALRRAGWLRRLWAVLRGKFSRARLSHGTQQART